MSDFSIRVQIDEAGPREGFRFERGPIRTARKIALIDPLSDTGVNRIQVASFVNANRVPGGADADAVVAESHRRPGIRGTSQDASTTPCDGLRRP
jgi:hydroxymethylglutaryl-CoA lyase